MFATKEIIKDEIVGKWEGEVFVSDRATKLPCNASVCPRDYAIQISPSEYIYTNEIIRYMNHSCEPNIGYLDTVTMVALRDIKPGEELVVDYEMSEDSDFTLECKCGSTNCRKKIGAYKNLPLEIRQKYGKYISPWLRNR